MTEERPPKKNAKQIISDGSAHFHTAFQASASTEQLKITDGKWFKNELSSHRTFLNIIDGHIHLPPAWAKSLRKKRVVIIEILFKKNDAKLPGQIDRYIYIYNS